LVTIY